MWDRISVFYVPVLNRHNSRLNNRVPIPFGTAFECFYNNCIMLRAGAFVPAMA
jgi:hypothetical protein